MPGLCLCVLGAFVRRWKSTCSPCSTSQSRAQHESISEKVCTTYCRVYTTLRNFSVQVAKRQVYADNDRRGKHESVHQWSTGRAGLNSTAQLRVHPGSNWDATQPPSYMHRQLMQPPDGQARTNASDDNAGGKSSRTRTEKTKDAAIIAGAVVGAVVGTLTVIIAWLTFMRGVKCWQECFQV